MDSFYPAIYGVVLVVDNLAKELSKFNDVTVVVPYSESYIDDSKRPYKVIRVNSIHIPSTEYRLGSIQTKTDSYATNNSTNQLNVWGGDSVGLDFSITQDVSGNSGALSFSIQVSGGEYSGCEIYAFVSVNGSVTKGTTITSTTGWDNWQTASVSNVSVTSSDTVIVGLYMSISTSGAWAHIDNASLSVS